MPHALELATASREVDKGWSQDDVVAYVQKNWRLQGIKCPAHKTVKDYISKAIKEGDLPEKVRQRTGSRS